MRKTVLIILAIFLLVDLIIGIVLITYYNKFITLKESIDEQWAQVENQLKRRNDLIPNLVNTAKGYMEHEQDVFKHIADARARMAGAGTKSEKIDAANSLTGALGRLLVVVEQYPDLKANQQFNRLSDELAGTENRIAVERMRYNRLVKDYNMTIKKFPGNIFAGIFGKEAGTYFEVPEEEQEVPEVAF